MSVGNKKYVFVDVCVARLQKSERMQSPQPKPAKNKTHPIFCRNRFKFRKNAIMTTTRRELLKNTTALASGILVPSSAGLLGALYAESADAAPSLGFEIERTIPGGLSLDKLGGVSGKWTIRSSETNVYWRHPYKKDKFLRTKSRSVTVWKDDKPIDKYVFTPEVKDPMRGSVEILSWQLRDWVRVGSLSSGGYHARKLASAPIFSSATKLFVGSSLVALGTLGALVGKAQYVFPTIYRQEFKFNDANKVNNNNQGWLIGWYDPEVTSYVFELAGAVLMKPINTRISDAMAFKATADKVFYTTGFSLLAAFGTLLATYYYTAIDPKIDKTTGLFAALSVTGAAGIAAITGAITYTTFNPRYLREARIVREDLYELFVNGALKARFPQKPV